MSPAVLVHRNGFGLALWASRKEVIAAEDGDAAVAPRLTCSGSAPASLRNLATGDIVSDRYEVLPVTSDPSSARPFFERILLPHRSLPPRGFRAMMLVLGLISCVVGIGFLSIGAWPVTGFFGLDVGLIYLAFRISYRSARQHETLRLAEDAFTVERVSVRGEYRAWRFQPFWLRVILEERDDESNRLLVASHGKSLVIGDFLPPSMRRELAQTLRDALRRWRDTLNPAANPAAAPE